MSGGNVLDNTKIVLKSLVLSSHEPLTMAQLASDYQSQEGKPIPFATLGYPNLRMFLLSMPELLAYDTVNQKFTLAGKAAGNSEHIHKLVSGQKSKSRSHSSKAAYHSNRSNNANHRNNSRQMQQHPQIWDNHPMNHYSCSQQNWNTSGYPANQQRLFEPGNLLAPPTYIQNSLLGNPMSNLMTNLCYVTNATSEVPVHIPNFSSTTSGIPPLMSINWQGSKNFNKPKNETAKKKSSSSASTAEPTGSKKHNDNPKMLNGNQSDSNSEEIGALPPIDDDDPIKYIGAKMMSCKYGTKIPQATMPETLETGHVHRICVTEVTRFPHFYFQFADTEDIMLGLQDELSSVCVHSEKIIPSEIQIGNACSAWYASKWSRAEILSRPDDSDRVKLLFVDYGTIDSVSIEDIRYLVKEICQFPRLCYRGALAFLEPSRNNHIEKKIIRKFCELVADRSLIAVFSNVDESDDISMTLVDTNDPKNDVILNKVLLLSLQEMEQKSDKELDVLK